MDKNERYSNLLDEQIRVLRKENRYVEFKSNYQEAEKLGRYISALSNGACLDRQDYGYLYFGVEDETHNVRGTKFDVSAVKAKGNESLELYLRRMLSPKVDFSIEEFFYHGDKHTRIVVFRINAAVGEPTCFARRPWVRVDSHTTELAPYTDWVRYIYNSKVDWTAQVIDGSTLADLDESAIK